MDAVRAARTWEAWLALFAVMIGCGVATAPPVSGGSNDGTDGEQLSDADAEDAESSDDGDVVVVDLDGELDAFDTLSGDGAVDAIDATGPLDKNGKPCNGLRKKGCPCTKGEEECCYYDAAALGLGCGPSRGCQSGEDCKTVPHHWEEVWECRCWAYGPPDTWSDKCIREHTKNWCDENYLPPK